jgi:mono/diheme cytochrome c family protein
MIKSIPPVSSASRFIIHLVLLILLVSGTMSFIGAGCAARQAAFRPNPEEVAKGRSLFSEFCRDCHGQSDLQASLQGRPVTFESLSSAVRDGVPESTMFGYQRILNDEELRAVVTYVMSTLSGDQE